MTGTQFTLGNQGTPQVLYSQSGGSATMANAFNMGFNDWRERTKRRRHLRRYP